MGIYGGFELEAFRYLSWHSTTRPPRKQGNKMLTSFQSVKNVQIFLPA
jgi:hypothetical protein